MEHLSGTDDFYEFVDLLGARLVEAGLPEHSRKLHVLVHEVAWTTGSELLGELGAELKSIQELHEPNLPADLSQAISRALAFVRRYWPDLQARRRRGPPFNERLQLTPNSSLRSIRGTVLAACAVPQRWRSALLGAAELPVRDATQPWP